MQIPLSCSTSNKWKNKSSHKAQPDNYRCDILKAYDPDRDQCFPAIETIIKVGQYLIKNYQIKFQVVVILVLSYDWN